jgi:hypothetical protein
VLFRRENFGFFQHACLSLGCDESETCVFEDVYDDRNMGLFLVNIIALARHTQYRPGYSGPILEDASKTSGPGQKVDAQAKYIPSMLEVAAAQAGEAKDHARYVEHGIMMNPNDPTAPVAPQGKGYITTAQDEANAKAAQAKGPKYVEHGILMNPDENRPK